MDLIETEGVDLHRLTELVPDAHSEHWQQTLDFLDVIVSAWPTYLSAAGRLSPADRRNRLIRSEAARLIANPPPGPVIVAGVTGSIPATAELMQAVASLDNGVIVLPGLDCSLEAESCAAIVSNHPEHPQSGLIRLVNALGVGNDQVEELDGSRLPQYASDRNQLVGEVLRPATTSDQWYTLPDRIDFAGCPGGIAACAQIDGGILPGRSRGHSSHPARSNGTSGTNGCARLSGQTSRPPRGHSPGDLGHSGR